MEPLVIGKHCTVELLETVPCVVIRWNGLPPSEEFRKGCLAVLDLMKRNGLTKVITDNTMAKVFSMDDQRWLNQEWLPKAQKLGYRYSAVLVKENDPFVSFAVKNIMSKRDATHFQAEFFYHMNDAVDWLSGVA
jgi:hypothetical protein